MVFIHVIRGRPSGLVQFPVGEAVKIDVCKMYDTQRKKVKTSTPPKNIHWITKFTKGLKIESAAE